MPRARDAGEPVRFEFGAYGPYGGNGEPGRGNGGEIDGGSVDLAPIPGSAGTSPVRGGGRSCGEGFEEESVPGSLSSVTATAEAVPGSRFPVAGATPPPAPSAYRSEFDAIARAMASEGKTNAVIATVGLGVAVRTLYRWIEPEGAGFVPSLAEALRLGRAEAVARVEAALFEMAVGGTRRTVNRKGEEVETEIPPNITAVQFFLKGRARAEWGGAEEAPVPAAAPAAAGWDLSRLTIAEREAWLALKRRASGGSSSSSSDDGED